MIRKKRGVRPGLPPGAYRVLSESETAPRLEIIDYTAATIDRRLAELEDVSPAPPGMNRWIRVHSRPNAALLDRLQEVFQVHPLILEDMVSGFRRTKLEQHGAQLFTSVRTVTLDASIGLVEDDLSLILWGSTLISAHSAETDDYFGPIETRLESDESLIRHKGADFLYQALIDLAVDRYFPVLEQIEEQATQVEAAILSGPVGGHLEEIGRLRLDTGRIRSALWSIRDMSAEIERLPAGLIDAETLIYFRDIQDHVVHLIDTLTHLRDVVTTLMELHLSSASNRTNDIMKVLTIISTIFIPVTFVAGVYGMNFRYMPELASRWGYPVVLGVMGLITVGMLIFFRRKKWL